ncbi:EthD domain-containing protein [Speluncibacter jeojiensis]|uniref:EthD domain-containing protein n=1 Tax=Speluncibacter jeojiensis TaxID=2710754 RepID=A0A9X4M3E0_9ACTN|nr:EthD domain-containing protein [Rhodococcus sp. D2-41]MDG3016300.1 EthD domain-containing protein [Corynebacteriales bacterium D3-21]
MYTLWAAPSEDPEAFASALLGPVAREVVAAGVRGLQVNVADGSVADATVRIASGEPISALVSVWLDSVAAPERTAVEDVLGAAAARIAGYLVTESVPLAPPAGQPGARDEGFAQISLLRRPSSLDRENWLENWQGRHTAVAIETQSTFGYVQNAVVRAVTPDAPPTDAIVEELFPTAALSDPYAFYDVAAGDKPALRQRVHAMLDSVATFGGQEGIDVVPTSRYVTLSPFARS